MNSELGVIGRLFKEDSDNRARKETNIERRAGKQQVRGIDPVLRRNLDRLRWWWKLRKIYAAL